MALPPLLGFGLEQKKGRKREKEKMDLSSFFVDEKKMGGTLNWERVFSGKGNSACVLVCLYTNGVKCTANTW